MTESNLETERTYTWEEEAEIKSLLLEFKDLDNEEKNNEQYTQIENRLKELEVLTPEGDFYLLVNEPVLDAWINDLLFLSYE